MKGKAVRPTLVEADFVSDLWNGMFNFNGDGVTDIGEEFLAFKIFEAVTEESEDGEDDEDNG